MLCVSLFLLLVMADWSVDWLVSCCIVQYLVAVRSFLVLLLMFFWVGGWGEVGHLICWLSLHASCWLAGELDTGFVFVVSLMNSNLFLFSRQP